MTGSDRLECSQQRHPLLLEGGKKAAKASERICAPSTRKRPDTFCCTLSRRISCSAWFSRKCVGSAPSRHRGWREGDGVAEVLYPSYVVVLDMGGF
jgi:hypothetical protein